ncbi:RagB/SusD family nutrient uptake outer membrane protein [Geofilum rubicundum]|uniref:RagB/SusD family nutrient uptake outer membrane protein n=1 Tax=Geofilum rubicundum TaxID=472113 RepID=UPI000784347C|nr:RagB/SusD family nutrient uptake outer membrane protein [Geofilum rubicundum]
MKISKYILGIVCFATVFSSCEDYLEVEAPSSFDTDYVFSNTEDAKMMLMGAYQLFAEDTYTSRMSNVWMQNTDVEVMQPSANPDGSRRDVWSLQGGFLSGFNDIFKSWRDNYLVIDRANQIIEGIQASSLANDPTMRMYLGEAYALRAYRYYLLINFFGDVPYFTEAAKAGMELDIPKTDKNIIYTGCIQDLVDIEGEMFFADEYSAGIERMNREFAMGMISRLALFRAGYGMTVDGTMKKADDYLDTSGDESLAVTYTALDGSQRVARTSEDYYLLAREYAQKLVALKDRALNADFAKVFRNQCEWIAPVNDDVLFEVAFMAANGGDVGWCVGTTVRSSSKGSTTIQVNLSPAYYFSFDDADVRRDATVSKVEFVSDTEEQVSSITGLAVAKWNRLWLNSSPGASSSKGTGINWPLMRYSDVLLMLAEAENELNGPSALAKDALKRVRRRAFPAEAHASKVEAYVNNITSEEDFFNAVVDERAWELGGEGLRKFDLVRWNIYGQKIVETKETLNNMGKAAHQLEMSNPEVAQYANLADYLYYQIDNGHITFLNTKYKPELVPELIVDVTELDAEGNEGAYARANWARNLFKKVTDENSGEEYYEPADYTERCWRGYKDESGQSAVPYLLPISTQTIEASEFLTNEGYGHVMN